VGILNEVNGEDYIEKFNSAGVGTTFTTDVLEPSGLAFNSTGNLYVSNLETNTIEAFTPSGVESVFADTHMNSPAALAFNATGTLYVADAGNIVEFSPSGVGTNFSSLVGATGLAFNATGTLFAGNQDGYIFECNSTGVYTHFVRMAVGEEPVGLAFNSAGDLFVTTNENTIVEYSPDGVGTVFADSNLSVPGALAFDPVPEPGTSGLLAGALGALLAASRRRCRGFRRFLMGGCRVFPPNSLDDCEKRKDWAEVEGAG
jgi:sugar lactone lactonase YvrE